jgi:hypothetical protein
MFNTKKIALAVICVICFTGLVVAYKTLTYVDDNFLPGGDIQQSINTHQN